MRNYLLLTALAMTVSATAQVEVERPVKMQASNAMKAERGLFLQRSAAQEKTQAKSLFVKGARDLNSTKKISVVTTKDEETTKELAYRHPSLTFYTAAAGGYIYPAMYLPAFANHTWFNVSQGYTKEDPFQWSYVNVEGEEATASSVNLTTAHYAAVNNSVTPILSCGEESYQYVDGRKGEPYEVFYGWQPKIAIQPSEGEEWLLQLYDNWEAKTGRGLYYSYTATQNAEDAAIITNQWKKHIDEEYADYGIETQAVKVTSFANLLPAPASPYILSQVTFPVCIINEAGAEVAIQISRVTENGELDSITSMPIVVADAHELTAEGYAIVDLTADVKYTDENGMEQDFLKVSDPILIELVGVNDNEKITECMALAIAQEESYVLRQREWYGVTGLEATVKMGGQTLDLPIYMNMPNGAYWGDAAQTWVKYPVMFDMVLDAYYPYIALFDPDDNFNTVVDDVVNINLPATEAEKYYQATSYEWQVSADADPVMDWVITDAAGDELPEWLNVYPTVQVEGEKSYLFLIIEAEDLPEGTTSRSATVKVEENGAVRTLNIVQGENSGNAINSVEAAANNAGVAAIYTIEGKKVSSVDNLNKGVYIVKKTDGSSVKVVKK